MAAALAAIRHRVQRLLVRHGLEPADDATGPADRLTEESSVLAGIVGASVQGRVALGQRAGARVRLAAMTPRPETNLLICDGLLAARARLRARVVAYGRVMAEPTAMAPTLVAGAEGTKAKRGSRAWSRAHAPGVRD